MGDITISLLEKLLTGEGGELFSSSRLLISGYDSSNLEGLFLYTFIEDLEILPRSEHSFELLNFLSIDFFFDSYLRFTVSSEGSLSD